MNEGGKRAIYFGELISLILLILVLLFFANYLSQEEVTLEGRGGELLIKENINNVQWFFLNLKNNLIANKRAVLVISYILLALLVTVLVIKIIRLTIRKRNFREQNEISRKKILEYQKSFNPPQPSDKQQ